MAWSNLGIVDLDLAWRYFAIPADFGSTFRVRHNWVAKPYGYALIGTAFFNDRQLYGVRRCYPDQAYRIIDLPVPEQFSANDVQLRYVAVAISPRTILIERHGWTIEIDEWIIDSSNLDDDFDLDSLSNLGNG